MKTTTDHLPTAKKDELNRIVKFIHNAAKVEMIILFGSYSRGDWVEDSYVEDHVTYEYQSDYDILVVLENKEKEEKLSNVWEKVENQIARDHVIKTPVSIITENVDFFNQKINEGHYFYSDIRKEGVALYHSHRFSLVKGKQISVKERMKIAREDFCYWSEQAKLFLRVF